MKALFVAWKDTQSAGGWYPVGRLDANVAGERYEFRYTEGALTASKERGFEPFDSFPDFRKEYVSVELFPFFANRVQNQSRPSFHEYLRRLDLDKNLEAPFDPIEALAVSEGRRATDSLEIFPKVERTERGAFAIKFFLHGGRYLSPASSARILQLQPGEDLGVAMEFNNDATHYAIQLQTRDRMIIGYAPHYLLSDLAQVISQCSIPVSAHVSRVNRPPAPPNQRVLVVFEGCWPGDYQPMNGPEFKVLSGSELELSPEEITSDPYP
jgi:hypothetical protein